MDSKGLPLPATQKRSRDRSVCCCLSLWLCSIVTVLIATFGIAFLILFIAVHPQLPKYDVQNFQLTGLSNRTLSAADPDPNTILSFQIVNRNPNKEADVYYDDSFVNVISEVDDSSVGSQTIPEYSQSHKTTTTLEPIFQIQKETSNLLLNDNHDLSDWKVLVKVDVKARLKAWSVKSSKFKVKARCNLSVDVLSTPQKITYKHCKVDT